MTQSIQSIPVAKLLLDTENPRLADPEESQHEAMVELARQQGGKLVALARDIVEHRLDPLNFLAVVAMDGTSRRYRVLEGNRRTLALKALETPSIVLTALNRAESKALSKLSARYHEDPIDEVNCILFDDAKDAQHWIQLRHTGANAGAGLAEWSSNEKDRYDARHNGGFGKSGGQALALLKSADEHAAATQGVPVTTLTRLLSNPHVRARLGLSQKNGQLFAHYPKAEVLKALRRVVDDLRDPNFKVANVYTAKQREAYVNDLPDSVLPDPSTRLDSDHPLDELPATASATTTKAPDPAAPKARQPRVKSRPKERRTTVIAQENAVSPKSHRLNTIFVELSTLDIYQHPNAGAVLLRVFIELSVDHYIGTTGLMTEEQRSNTKLAVRLKKVGQHLLDENAIPRQMFKMVERVADAHTSSIAASLITFNQFVHNEYVFPTPNDLMTTWDEIGPFMAKVNK